MFGRSRSILLFSVKRRIFCKTTASILLSVRINPVFALSNTSNEVLLGEIFVNNKLVKGSFENLNNSTIECRNSKAVLKVENNVFLIKANTKIKFISNKINEVISGSFYGVFGKRQKEFLRV